MMAHHDDAELERIASNNPAMTIPASSILSRYNNHAPSRPSHSRANTSALTYTVTTRTALSPDGSDATLSTTNADETGSDQRLTVPSSKDDVGWRRVVRNFSPSWFSTTMGTGVVSLLLISIPFKADWLYWLSAAFFGLNTILFACAFSISVVRYTVYPEIWTVMINDPTNSLFLSTIPMGFATLVEAWIALCCPYWGRWSVTFAWSLWIVDSVVACGITVSLMFLLISESHQQQLDRITAAQLLPIAATIVAAGAGVRSAEVLNKFNDEPNRALSTLIASYIMWGMATPFAMTVLVMYYQRLALHKLPSREIIVSSFLPLGPLGMGGWTIFYAGKVAREILPRVQYLSHVPLAGDMLYMMGLLTAVIMWGSGLVWLSFALATIWSCRPFPFNMGWWGFTFPLGVFAISTFTFGDELPSPFFKVLGTVFSVAVIVLWCVVAAGTVRGAWNGKLFHAPCLKNLSKERQHVPNEVDVEKA